LTAVAFGSTASKSAESIGMTSVGFRSLRRQWRTDSADRTEWDGYGKFWGDFVDVNANANVADFGDGNGGHDVLQRMYTNYE